MYSYNRHADDYAISLNASKDILHLIDQQKLDSISILPNMPCFDACFQMLHSYLTSDVPFLHVSIHLNFMEGHCCADTFLIPDLVNEKGYFKTSWGSLLTASYNPFSRNKIKKQLKVEAQAQINKILACMPPKYQLEIDSHQHTHMIPVVWDALKEVIIENSYQVQCIRLSKEPFMPFVRSGIPILSFGIANIIKNILLNIYGITIEKQMFKMNISYTLLWGLLMSGHMDFERISKIDPYMQKYLSKKQRTMELLFHPGSVLPNEITEANVKPGFVEFHLSPNRTIEYEAVKNI